MKCSDVLLSCTSLRIKTNSSCSHDFQFYKSQGHFSSFCCDVTLGALPELLALDPFYNFSFPGFYTTFVEVRSALLTPQGIDKYQFWLCLGSDICWWWWLLVVFFWGYCVKSLKLSSMSFHNLLSANFINSEFITKSLNKVLKTLQWDALNTFCWNIYVHWC